MIPESRAPRSLFLFFSFGAVDITITLTYFSWGWLHRYRCTQFIYMYT